MSLVYGLCILRFKHFVRGKKFDALQNVYIPADCQSWRYLSINPYSFAGKELAVNGWPLSDQFNFGVGHVVHLATKLKSTLSFPALLACTVSRLLQVDFLVFST